MEQNDTPAKVASNDRLGLLLERLRERRMLAADGLMAGVGRTHAKVMWVTDEPDPDCALAADEIERLVRRFEQAADKALTYAESYEMAVARCVLSLDYMHPEQVRAFNEAWAAKRAELRALKA